MDRILVPVTPGKGDKAAVAGVEKYCSVCGQLGHVWCSESPPEPPAFPSGSPEDRLLNAIFGQSESEIEDDGHLDRAEVN